MPYVKVYDPALDQTSQIAITNDEFIQLETKGYGVTTSDTKLPDMPVLSRLRTKDELGLQKIVEAKAKADGASNTTSS